MWVIPCGEGGFELPAGCHWIEDSKLLRFLRQNSAHPLYSKYVALLQNHCAYFDTDIILLREPRKWLEIAPSDAFVVADTEWAKNRWTYSADSLRFLATLSSCWPLFTFNSGFFAFEKPLYEEDELIDVIQSPEYRSTCLERKAPPSTNRPSIGLSFESSADLQLQSAAARHGIDDGGGLWRQRTRDGPSNPAAPAFLHFAGPMFEEDLPVTEAVYVFPHRPRGSDGTPS